MSFALNYINILKHKFSPGIVILLQTHMQVQKVHMVHHIIGLKYNVECVPSISRSGGTLVL